MLIGDVVKRRYFDVLEEQAEEFIENYEFPQNLVEFESSSPAPKEEE